MDHMTSKLEEQWNAVPILQSRPLPYVAAFLVVVLAIFYWHVPSNVPVLNAKGFFEFSDERVKKVFLGNARQMLHNWFEENPDKPVSVYTDTGTVIVLPGSMANEIRNDKRFHLRQRVERMMHGRLPGFEVFRDDNNNQLVTTVINKDLTKQLAKVTAPLAEETSLALADLLGEDTEWHELPLQGTILKLISRLSSRVFLGTKLCRNEEWLQVTREYAVIAFLAAQDLRLWSPWIRPIANLFLSKCRMSRALIQKARELIQPVIQERTRLKAKSTEGQASEFNDAISWFEDAANAESFDPQIVQLSLSTVAIHTTTDLLCQTLADIAMHPQIIEPLREEIISILSEDNGLKTTSFGKMKLLDSCIKESQRLKPLSMASMGRIATEQVVLSDGTVIPKGQSIIVDSSKMWDSKVHPTSPGKWDGYRFLRMREDPKKRDIAQLITTSPEQIAFGYGVHACPGRFFAGNEIKIALAAILLKYELKLEEGQTPRAFDHGFTCNFDFSVKISVKRRKKEIGI
ncbi:cytochrome P450 [Aspergillus alliaceus]|uniref:cytochrome P450 n=1 Tax=Petromyces alliaceus TaxID=209559 RepID=UPI0012A44431|nr:cytochrome P450 monooxygenase [Aspergillus alliaceus]KAB8227102.1 cytochrome P450 monooxygenase [Aspergillus alliaceus]